MESLLSRLAAQKLNTLSLAQETQLALPVFTDIPTQPRRADIFWALYALLGQDSSNLFLISGAYTKAPNYFPQRRASLITTDSLVGYETPVEKISIYSDYKNEGIELVMQLSESMGSERLKIALGKAVSIASQQNGTWRLFDADEMEVLNLGLEFLGYDKPEEEELADTANFIEGSIYFRHRFFKAA